MPLLEQEMAEVLESECSVEMDKLLSLCRHGIPDRLRGEAWKYLLGVMRPEKSQELSLGKLMEQRYQQLERAGQADAHSELTRQIKAEVRGYRSGEPFFREARTHQRLERLLRTYLYRHTSGYIPGMVHLLGPFVQVYRESDTDAYYGARLFCCVLASRSRFLSPLRVPAFCPRFLSRLRDPSLTPLIASPLFVSSCRPSFT
jgi:hypothetical protein